MFRRIVAVVIVSISMMGSAQAAPGVAPTNLNIHLKDGQVYGMLTGPPWCRAGQPVDLVVDGLDVATTTTDGLGRYSFSYVPTPGEQIRTEFDGAIVGVHPDTTVCRASVSRTIVGGVLPSSGSRAAPAASAANSAFAGSEIVKAAAAGAVMLVSDAVLLAVDRHGRARGTEP